MYQWNSPLKDLLREVKEQLYYTSTERRGIILLCFITLLFGMAPYAVGWIYPKKIPAAVAIESGIVLPADAAENDALAENSQPVYFDPNTASGEMLKTAGIPPYFVERILHYREKGGKFFKKEDLKKIYGFPEAIYQRLEPFIDIGGQSEQSASELTEQAAVRFNFDPNIAPEAALRQLGLPGKVVQNMLKYRAKGGHFKYKEDVSKIYGMPENIYLELASFILLPSKKDNPAADLAAIVSGIETPSTYQPGVYNKKKSVMIDINRATVEEWQELNGVGPAFAKRIVTFRDKLGGFYAVGQVAETFGLPDSTFQQIEPQLMLSPLIRKIDLNTASLEVLAAHPYIKRNIAQIIVNYRSQHGPFSIPVELYKIQALSKEAAAKILPYVSITN